MSLLFALLGIVDLMIWAIQQIVRSRETKDKKLNNVHRVRQLGSMKACNAVAFSLSRLVDEDGAGDWPPRVAHHDLPFCFQPYHDTYLELVPHLSTATPSLDDTANKERMANFRFSMRELLTRRINISEVESALAKVESGDYSYLSRETYNAIYCCIAVCRHAYR
jgi:hypothetical protein